MVRDIDKGLGFLASHRNFETGKMAEMLEKAYLMQEREDKHRQKFSFSPSTLFYGHGKCPRYWAFAFDGVVFKEKNDALGIANMAYGTEAHTRIQRLFKDAGILVDAEIEINHKNPPIRGFIDLLVRWQGEVMVGEIKTARQESFDFRKYNSSPPGYHLMQVLVYMKVTGKKRGFILYENKNDQTFLIIPVTMTAQNEMLVEETFEWMRKVRAAWEAKEKPARPFTKRSKECKSCPVYDVCWNENPDGSLIIPPLVVPK